MANKDLFNVIKIRWYYNDEPIGIVIPKESEPEIKYNMFVQIYGDCHLYGRDNLLFLGTLKDFPIISEKLTSNKIGIENLRYVFGGLLAGEYPEDINNAITILRSVIKPPYNKINFDKIPLNLKQDNYLIMNIDNREALPRDVTNKWLY